MTFDPESKTIVLGKDSSFAAESVKFFITVLRDLDDPASQKDWKVISDWLSLEGNYISDDDFDKIGVAYRAYLHFASKSDIEKNVAAHDQAGEVKIESLPPKQVQEVFQRLVTSGGNIAEKPTEKVDAYPKYFTHLVNIKGRVLWAALPVLAIVFILAIASDGFIAYIGRRTEKFLFEVFLIYSISFLSITLLHVFLKYVPQRWQSSREVRLWIFGSTFWAAFVLLMMLLFEYEYLDSDLVLQRLSVAIIIPLFFASARIIYLRYIR